MYQFEAASINDHATILKLWEASVKATHHFLLPGDIAFYKQTIIDHNVFDQVSITTLKNSNGELLGFIGISGTFLEMLFINPALRGKGIGKLLLLHAIKKLGVTKVDVNEQNENAVQFYQHFGFKISSRSPLDGTGKPYPILHLQIA